MKKSLKYMIPVSLSLVVLLIASNFFLGANSQARADDLIRTAQEDSGLTLSDLTVTDEEADELGLTTAQAEDACTVYQALAANGIFSANEYIVAYLTDGGDPVPAVEVVTAGSLINKPTDPYKPGYVFKHWEYKYPCNDQIHIWNFNSDVVGFNLVLVAVYEPEVDATYHSVTFDANGGTPIPNAQSVKDGDTAYEPIDPFLPDHNFIGWFDGNTIWDFDNVITGDLHLVAKYEDATVEYVVIFDADGGAPVPATQNVAQGAKVVEPSTEPYKALGYVFTGWYYDNGTSEILWDFNNDVVNQDMVLRAKYELLFRLVTYDYAGGEDADGNTLVSAYFRYGMVTTKPADPVKAGHTFMGWYYSDPKTGITSAWNFDTKIYEDMVLLAVWK